MWITSKELGQYLRSRYPEMKFKEKTMTWSDHGEGEDHEDVEFVSDISKKVKCDFHITTFSDKAWEEWAKTTWKDKTIVHLNYDSSIGRYQGGGWATDNRTEMESGIARMVKKVKELIGYKEQPRQISIFDLMEGI